MIKRILEAVTKKDDLERVAARGDVSALNEYLRKRTVFVPKKPKHFLDADTFTEGELLTVIEKESEAARAEPFEPWILEVDGKRRLPVFSSQKKMEQFSKRISADLNQVFALLATEALLYDIPDLGLDYVDLNLFCGETWEIGMK